ncbi:amino acid aminotransferase [Methylibium sp.]|uniref:amino acid aminotransferase n=1 Tax=Methylibium sp. TaxID=2067992 RepID=UPI00286B43A8|nr:amino acid aminotransferase [Methylibium sp.]
MFKHVEPYPGDPIFSLNEDFQNDPRAHKINLGIGIYFDEEGRIPVLESVRRAEARLLAAGGTKAYLPIEGAANMRGAVQALLFGAGHPVLSSGRVVTLQTVGSSGGLKVGADFIARWLPGSQVWVSDPTWDNHRAMFEGAGLVVHTYPYYDAGDATAHPPRPAGGLEFDAMLAALAALPPRSVVLLHACCHNPTGVDLSRAQWDALIPLLRERELLPYLDLAYQGFGEGIDADAYAVRALAAAGIGFFVANSFSKSMSVYGERCGALSVVCPDALQAEHVLGQLKATVRRNYSSPPIHGGQIVALVLGEPELRALWEVELAAMRARILAMRRALHDALVARLPGHDLGYLLSQRGMFSYTGLCAPQVDVLREQHGVYLLRSGRLCVAGLNEHNLRASADAMASVLAG